MEWNVLQKPSGCPVCWLENAGAYEQTILGCSVSPVSPQPYTKDRFGRHSGIASLIRHSDFTACLESEHHISFSEQKDL